MSKHHLGEEGLTFFENYSVGGERPLEEAGVTDVLQKVLHGAQAGMVERPDAEQPVRSLKNHINLL